MNSLHEQTLALVKEERRLTGLIIENLQKISDSKLFLEMAYSSLFQYCTKALGYSEASAYRRIEAVKVMRVVPEIKEKLNSGELNLTTLAIAQSFFKISKASTQEKREALQKIEGCSRPETERLLAEHFKVEPPKLKEKVHFHREGAALHVHLPNEVLKKLDRIKSLRSHKNPNMSYADVIADMCEIVLKKIDPMEKAINQKPVEKVATENEAVQNSTRKVATENEVIQKPMEKVVAQEAAERMATMATMVRNDTSLRKSNTTSRRYVSANLKSTVWRRDEDQCIFTDPQTGRRCDSKHLLQLDHDTPLFLGGETSQQNLRLLCHAHHRLRDREFMVFD